MGDGERKPEGESCNNPESKKLVISAQTQQLHPVPTALQGSAKAFQEADGRRLTAESCKLTNCRSKHRDTLKKRVGEEEKEILPSQA